MIDMKESFLKIVMLLVRVISLVMLLPVMVGLILRIFSPRTLQQITRFINELRRFPEWGSWLALLGCIVILTVLFGPVIYRLIREK